MTRSTKRKDSDPVRFAVVGLGYISQVAVLPAFEHAENAQLAALVSHDGEKRHRLGKKYGVYKVYSYEDYQDCLESGDIDAVYIALPNSLHREYAVKAAEAGIHVLCEKPMAVTEAECRDMIAAAESRGVKLMVAYRLHFDTANLEAIEVVRSGLIGEPRLFTSTFTMQVRDRDNIRLDAALGGGTLYDIGVYCINAARALFRAEPSEVLAISANNGEVRFREVDEMTSAVLKFPKERLASFTTSFGAEDVASYRVVGTEGELELDSAYEYAESMTLRVRVGDETTKKRLGKRDQFAPELIEFSRCIKEDRTPEPSGEEGLADVRVIRALYESARNGRIMVLPPFTKRARPDLSQAIERPPVREPELVGAAPPSGK